MSSLMIAAGAAAAVYGPYAGNTAKVYHACSAASHPLSIRNLFSMFHAFYTANPSPIRLPYTWCGSHAMGGGEASSLGGREEGRG